MNCVALMLVVAFNKIQKDVGATYKTVATDSMLKAATELKRTSTDVAVSCDGSWQKRGFSSLNGHVTVISVDSGKCLDLRVKTKKCAACTAWENKKDSDEYQEFIAQHECTINHVESAGAMESVGLVETLSSSHDCNNLRCRASW